MVFSQNRGQKKIKSFAKFDFQIWVPARFFQNRFKVSTRDFAQCLWHMASKNKITSFFSPPAKPKGSDEKEKDKKKDDKSVNKKEPEKKKSSAGKLQLSPAKPKASPKKKDKEPAKKEEKKVSPYFEVCRSFDDFRFFRSFGCLLSSFRC